MALHHSRLGLENDFLENKSGRIFCVREVNLTKSCQQIWVRVNQHSILFMHHIWVETVIWGAVFIIQTSDKMQYFTFKTNCTHSIFRTIRGTRGLLAKPFKIFPKSPIRPAGSHFWQAPNFKWTLKELRFKIIKNLLCLFFLFNGFITMCNFKKRLIRAAFWVLLQAMFMSEWKQTTKRLKFQETTNHQ